VHVLKEVRAQKKKEKRKKKKRRAHTGGGGSRGSSMVDEEGGRAYDEESGVRRRAKYYQTPEGDSEILEREILTPEGTGGRGGGGGGHRRQSSSSPQKARGADRRHRGAGPTPGPEERGHALSWFLRILESKAELTMVDKGGEVKIKMWRQNQVLYWQKRGGSSFMLHNRRSIPFSKIVAVEKKDLGNGPGGQLTITTSTKDAPLTLRLDTDEEWEAYYQGFNYLISFQQKHPDAISEGELDASV